MKKYLLITVLFCSYSIAAQKINKLDSARIQTLKTQLLKAKGKTRIDILNNLAGEYHNAIGSTDSVHRDSVYKFASLANNEAAKLNYEFGQAYSLFRLAKYQMNYLKDSVAKNIYMQQAFQIAEKIKANEILGWYYYEKWELKKAIAYFKAANDKEGEADASAWLCYEYSQSGKYDEEGFKYCQRAVELANIKKINTPSWGVYISSFTFQTMSNLLLEVGDYEGALNYLKQAHKIARTAGQDMDWNWGGLYMHLKNYDSSTYYFERALKNEPDNRFLIKHTGKSNLLAKNYERSAQLLEKALFIMQTPEFAKRNFPANWKGQIHLELAQAYAGLNKNESASKNYKAALETHRKEYNRITARFERNKGTYAKAWQLKGIMEGLSNIFNALGIYDSAYIYLIKHNKLKDSLQDQNMIWRLNMQLSNYKKAAEEQKRSSQINLLNKDNQLKEQKLKQEAAVKKFLIAGLVLLLIAGVFIFRYIASKRRNEKLESEKKQAELQQRATELEMQALRTQMNPHFIFNCLSSINKFILKNDMDTASDYLTRFSRLIRQVLTNSQLSLIPLSDEIEMLRLYLDMERLRFSESFSYNIIYENTIEPETIYIPPMLLQPFCENAIWHGLMHKEGPGKLDIVMSIQNGELQCIIADNGIGREKATELKTKSGVKHKSFGLKITTERLALFNNEKTVDSFCRTEDIVDEKGSVAGTKVILNIKFKNNVHQPVKELHD